jgi:hypothetical protein
VPWGINNFPTREPSPNAAPFTSARRVRILSLEGDV